MGNMTIHDNILEWFTDGGGKTANHFIKHTNGWDEILNPILGYGDDTVVFRCYDRVVVGGNRHIRLEAVKNDLKGRVDTGWCECRCRLDDEVQQLYPLVRQVLSTECPGDILYLISYRRDGMRRIMAIMADVVRDTMPKYL